MPTGGAAASFEVEGTPAEVEGTPAPAPANLDFTSSDEDDDEGAGSGSDVVPPDHDPFPECVLDMDPAVRRLLKIQFRGFRRHMLRAIERNLLSDLDGLKALYVRQIMGPFLEGKDIQKMKQPEKLPDPYQVEEIDVPLPTCLTRYLIPCRIAKYVVNSDVFESVIIASILLAGAIVGAETYFNCDGGLSCRADIRLSCGDGLTCPLECCSAEDAGNAAGSFSGSGGPAFSNGTESGILCWQKGPMPECATGAGADAAMTVVTVLDRIVLLIFTAECILRILEYELKPYKYFVIPWNLFDLFIVVVCWIPGAEAMAVLRLLRLARLLKVLRMVEELQIILRGLANGLRSIGYIMLLLLVLFYLFAIAGILAFRDNDPIHFGTLGTAMLTLFRMSTMEDWTDVMYINMFGCIQYGYIGGSYCHDPEHCSMDQLCGPDGQTSVGYGMATAIFFCVFVALAGLVVMSLFVGVITTAMVEATQEAKFERRRTLVNEQKLQIHTQVEEAQLEGDVLKSRKAAEQHKRLRDAGHGATGVLAVYLRFSEVVKVVVTSAVFVNSITFCICIVAIIIGMQTYDEMEHRFGTTFYYADQVILGVFAFEIILKVIAMGQKPLNYFREPWNCFDFGVVAATFLPSAGMTSALRILRLLRVLKLFNNITELQIILAGLSRGVSSVSYIGLLMLLEMYVFGIVALYYFRKNDPVHFPNLHVTMLTLWRCATLEDWTDVMYLSMYGCKKYYIGNDPDLHKCENDQAYGFYSTAYWISYIMLSSFVMLNLVIGVVCSAMSEARRNHEMLHAKLARITEISTSTGVDLHVVENWCAGFFMLDDSEGWSDGNIDRADLDLALKVLGEEGLLSHRSRERLLIRANHTYPPGMITMTDFAAALANDLSTAREAATRCNESIRQWELRIGFAEKRKTSAEAASGHAGLLGSHGEEIGMLDGRVTRLRAKIQEERATIQGMHLLLEGRYKPEAFDMDDETQNPLLDSIDLGGARTSLGEDET